MHRINQLLLFLKEAYTILWMQQPAVFYGLSALIGTYCALNFSWFLLIPLFFLWVIPLVLLPNRSMQLRFFLAFLCAGGAWWNVNETIKGPEIPSKGIKGMAEFKISSVLLENATFGKRWMLHGNLTSFVSETGETYTSLPYTLTYKYKDGQEAVDPNYLYAAYGTLKSKPNRSFFLPPAPPENGSQ